MSSQQKEIEVKARIDNINELMEKIRALGVTFSEPMVQHDTVFLPKGIQFADIVPGTNILRIRQQDCKTLFTLKQRSKFELSKIEKELEVSNPEIAEEIIELLGFYEVVRIDKTRMSGIYKNFTICIDEVTGLGTFIEIEKITAEDEEEVQTELFQFLESLGIEKKDIIEKGYDTLLLQK